MCDGSTATSNPGAYPGSFRLGAAWDGLEACGPGPNEIFPGTHTSGSDHLVHFTPNTWGVYEWECVELSMRWMNLAWGVNPFPANGNAVVDNYGATKSTYNPYGPNLTVVQNGTTGRAPAPGDVLELGNSSDPHTEVVAGSYVNSQGNGTIRVITENYNSPTNGWDTLQVKSWVVQNSFAVVDDWLHNPQWSLAEPILYQLTSNGDLQVKLDQLHGGFTTVASGVRRAQIVGGGGSEPAPILVELRDNGVLVAGYDLPGAPMRQVATGVTQFSATSGEGSGGAVSIGWLTSTGDFYARIGSLTAAPVLEAHGTSSIALASNSPAGNLLLGYVDPRSRAFVKLGSGTFAHVATGVRTLSLADGGIDATKAAEGYVGVAGVAYQRVGNGGRFSRVASGVKTLSVASAGQSATPVLAYLTTGGDVYTQVGPGTQWLHEQAGATDIAVAAGSNKGGFPILGVRQGAGTWIVKTGSMSSGFVDEGPAASMGVGALVVS
jgi:hypothetical protein